jgi:type IV pilus assembly protein PilQ
MKPGKFTAAALAALMLTCNISTSVLAFSVDFAPGTPLVEALRALGYKSNKNLIVNGDLDGTIAMHMEDTDFDTVLRALSRSNDFSFEYLDDSKQTVLIAPTDSMSSIETFKLKHIDPETAAKQIALLTEADKVMADKENHTLTVSGSSSLLYQVRQELEKVDVASQQVNIQAMVVELSKGNSRNLGLSYLSNPWSKDTSIGGYNGFKFSVSAQHEETLSNGKVLARPNVTVFDGRKATILMGDKVPVFTSSSDSTDSDSSTTMTVEYKDVGVKLEVLPRINEMDKQTITLVIKPSVSTISQWVESGNNKAPQISERSAETTVRVKNGETILIGGLLKNEEIKSIKQIPFLSKIPILGELFKSRSTEKKDTEVVIAITPKIVYDEFGRPRVETQTSTKNLHDTLNKLRAERMNEVNNPRTDMDANYEIERAKAEQEKTKLAKKKPVDTVKNDSSTVIVKDLEPGFASSSKETVKSSDKEKLSSEKTNASKPNVNRSYILKTRVPAINKTDNATPKQEVQQKAEPKAVAKAEPKTEKKVVSKQADDSDAVKVEIINNTDADNPTKTVTMVKSEGSEKSSASKGSETVAPANEKVVAVKEDSVKNVPSTQKETVKKDSSKSSTNKDYAKKLKAKPTSDSDKTDLDELIPYIEQLLDNLDESELPR